MSRGIKKREIKNRISKVRKIMEKEGMNALIVIGRSFYDRVGNLAYLSNHIPAFPASTFSGTVKGLGHGVLLLPLDDEPVLLVDGPDYREDLVAIDDVRIGLDMPSALKEILEEKELTEATIGIVGSDIMPLTFYWDISSKMPKIQFENADDIVNSLRAVKSKEEIKLLKKAAEIADLGLKAALNEIKEGKKESEICATGIKASIEAGADFVRYLRVHSGKWSTMTSRWPQATKKKIKTGEIINLDLIGAYRGYQFDVNRSTILGKPSKKQYDLLEAGLKATRFAVKMAKPGIKVSEIVEKTLEFADEMGYKEYMSGFMGHGIGLETVEDPYILEGVSGELSENMVVNIEPGITVPEFAGVRIEQETIVKQNPEVIVGIDDKLW